MDKEVLGILAGVISICGFFFYLFAILRGDTKPSRVTWVTFFVTDLFLLVSYYDSGADATIWLMLVLTADAGIIAILSIFYGVGGWTKFDRYCIVLIVITLGTLFYKYSPSLVLALSTVAMLIGAGPTYKKAYSSPHTEHKTAWLIFATASVLNIVAIDNWESWQIILNPVSIALINIPVAFFVWFSPMRTKKTAKQ